MPETVVLPLTVVPPSFAQGRLRLLRSSTSAGEWWLAAQLLQEAYLHEDWGPLGLGGPLSYYDAAGFSRSYASILLTCARAGVLDPALSFRKAYKLARENLAATHTPL
jgi:hypothetical protein